jgi:hypothetical protein
MRVRQRRWASGGGGGFTLVELLLPAVQAAREAARRSDAAEGVNTFDVAMEKRGPGR